MFQEHSALQGTGQLLLAFAFLASGARNLFWKFTQHADRMAAMGLPWPRTILSLGFVLQFAGATFLLVDVERAVAAWMLVAFTVLASCIFHRWWLIADPLLRHLHIGNLLVNAGVVGGLLLVAAI